MYFTWVLLLYTFSPLYLSAKCCALQCIYLKFQVSILDLYSSKYICWSFIVGIFVVFCMQTALSWCIWAKPSGTHSGCAFADHIRHDNMMKMPQKHFLPNSVWAEFLFAASPMSHHWSGLQECLLYKLVEQNFYDLTFLKRYVVCACWAGIEWIPAPVGLSSAVAKELHYFQHCEDKCRTRNPLWKVQCARDAFIACELYQKIKM